MGQCNEPSTAAGRRTTSTYPGRHQAQNRELNGDDSKISRLSFYFRTTKNTRRAAACRSLKQPSSGTLLLYIVLHAVSSRRRGSELADNQNAALQPSLRLHPPQPAPPRSDPIRPTALDTLDVRVSQPANKRQKSARCPRPGDAVFLVNARLYESAENVREHHPERIPHRSRG